MDMRTIVSRLVAFETHENELAMQVFLQTVLKDLGFRCELQEVLPGRPNLIARRGGGGPLFVTHSDTFGPSDHPHPLELRAEGDMLYGRGALDAKGQIAALLKALSLSDAPCTVALTVDEENMGRGSEALRLPAEAAVVLEPTDLRIATAEAGFVEAEFEVRGQAAHCSLPESGRNAILAAYDVFEQMTRLPFMQASHPLFPAPWANLGLIQGGAGLNVVAQSCTMQVDFGVLPGVELEDAVTQIRRLSEQLSIRLRVLDLAPPFETPADSPVANALAEAIRSATGQAARLVGMRSWTDAENLVKQGIPTIVYGAGDLGIAHSSREAVSLADLETMAKTLAEFIDTWRVTTPFVPTFRGVTE